MFHCVRLIGTLGLPVQSGHKGHLADVANSYSWPANDRLSNTWQLRCEYAFLDLFCEG
jgi:hypothetical protein